jgi:DNA-binding response OmpR family regulator
MPRVALAYGDPHCRKVLAFWLRSVGYEVDLAATDDLPRALANGPRPELLLLDMDLPDGAAARAMTALGASSRSRRYPVLALTANGRPRCSGRAAQAIDGWLTKPCDFGDLALWLTRLVGPPLAHLVDRG